MIGGSLMFLRALIWKCLSSLALQGTGRMALQTGLHPAQLKDSVTSASRL